MNDRGHISFGAVLAQMADLGVERLYMKSLAENDNSKNQIYLGGNWSLLQAVPARRWLEPTPVSRGFIAKAELDLAWIDGRGGVSPVAAPLLILYPQYPEIRLSGFLRGAPGAPSFVGQRMAGRILLLGVTPDDRIYAYAAQAEDPLTREVLVMPRRGAVGALWELPMGMALEPRAQVVEAVRRVHEMGWLDPVSRTSDGSLRDCRGPNCGGYTLEAMLGIAMNGRSEPDLHGYELKSHKVDDFANVNVGSITLMTPEPTGGYYRTAGPEAFVRRFGAPDALGREDRLNFGGIHRFGQRLPRTGLTLTAPGWDADAGRLVDPSGGITLVTDDGEPAAIWPFTGLIEHWQRKHRHAVYVPNQSRKEPHVQYRYGDHVRFGEQTDFSLFMNALVRGEVYYDPGIKVEGASTADPRLKRRNQLRIRSSDLSGLYSTMETVDTTP